MGPAERLGVLGTGHEANFLCLFILNMDSFPFLEVDGGMELRVFILLLSDTPNFAKRVSTWGKAETGGSLTLEANIVYRARSKTASAAQRNVDGVSTKR